MSAEDTKLSALTAIDAVAAADLLYIVDDPSGTPTSKKATAQQLWTFKTATCRLLDTADTYYLTVKPNEALSGNRTLSIVVGDADRTVTLGSHFTTTATGTRTLTIALGAGDRTITLAGALTTAGDLITSGAYSMTLTATNTTSITLPTTGTLATLAGTEELTNKTLNASVGKGTWTASGTWTLPAVTLGGAITYGGVTLSNAVTGTGAMVLATSPTFTTQLTTPKIAAAAELELAPASASNLKVSVGAAGFLQFVNTGACAKLQILGATSDSNSAILQFYRYGGDYNWNFRQTTGENLVISSGTFGASTTDVLAFDYGAEANVGLGTTSWGASATYNIALGGGSTSPVLGSATADLVSLAAVDASAGHRRLYIQSEAGSAISLGDDRLNFAATTGLVSIASVDVLSLTATDAMFVATGISQATLTVKQESTVSGGYYNSAIKLIGVSAGFTTSTLEIRQTVEGADGTHRVDFLFNGGSVPALTLKSMNNLTIGTTSTIALATYNLVFGGGTSTPSLGSATADHVCIAAVDASAGHRRLYIQSEAGSAISLGDDRLNFAAATGYISLASVDRLSLSASGLSVLHATSGAKITLEVVSEDITISAGTQTKDSTANLLPANSTILDVSYRLKTDGGGIATIDVGSTTNADCYVDGGTCASAGDAGQFTVDGGDATYTGPHANAAAGKIRITTDVNSTGDSVVTVSVAYLQHGAATA